MAKYQGNSVIFKLFPYLCMGNEYTEYRVNCMKHNKKKENKKIGKNRQIPINVNVEKVKFVPCLCMRKVCTEFQVNIVKHKEKIPGKLKL